MESGAAQPQTQVFERSEKTAGPSRPASRDTARSKAKPQLRPQKK